MADEILAEETLAGEIIDAARALAPNGLGVGASGNVSVRSGEGFLITPSGVAYDALSPDMLVKVMPDGTAEGALKPSSEWRFHLDIYADRADAHAIVHCHSPYATAIACLQKSIPAFHYMVAVAGGADICCAGYATFGTQALSDAVVSALDGRRACLMANHGQIAIGKDVAGALALAQEVEELAKQYAIALQAGEPMILSLEEMAVVIEKFKTYGKQTETP